MGVGKVAEVNFQSEVLNATTPVLVDFWAEWCGPCKMIAPVIDEIAEELSERLKVVKVNVDEAQAVAAKYGIMSIPTLLLFKNGEVVKQLVGAMGKTQIVEKINEEL